MYKYRKIFFVLIIAGFFFPFNRAQHQKHISWPSIADSPWPVLRGDMQGTGRSRFIGPRTNNVIWRKDMPLGILYGPVIGYDDVLYMGERALSTESMNYFYAVDKNGNNLWTFETETYLPNNSGPVLLQDSTIYFFSRNEKMYALNPDGSLKWEQNIWANFRPFYPVAKNGDIYVVLVDKIVVVSPEGIIKDTLFIPGLGPSIVFSTSGDTMFFNTNGYLNAADLLGNVFWSYNFHISRLGIPLVDNQSKIYIFGADSSSSENYYLYCINPNGTVDWQYQVSLFLGSSSPTIDRNGNIILNARKVINSEERNCIISLDYYGNVNWVTPFEGDWDEHYINHGLVCDAEGKIYCGSSAGGYFYCFDSNGEILWIFDLGDLEYDSNPAIGSDGTLYIGTHISSLFQNHTQNLIAIRDTVATSVDDEVYLNKFELRQNYPNPFNPSTIISYSIPQNGVVTITVYDVLGRKVKTLVDDFIQEGSYEVKFNTKNLSSGVYIYRITAVDNGEILFSDTKQMLLLR